MADAPRFCRRAAYDEFAAQLQTLEMTDSLVRAAVAVSMHELDGVLPDDAERSLDDLANQVQRKVKSVTPSALVARLHEVLFEEHGFKGNTENYFTPENSYLPCVLTTRRGIPVTLSLIYKSVAQRLGLVARGINTPSHFLAAVKSDGNWMIVDPFESGQMLGRQELLEKFNRYLKSTDHLDTFLTTATHADWLSRIIRNLEFVFTIKGREHDRLAMDELQGLLRKVMKECE